MSHYQYILLDWDGNLAKTLDVWLDVSNEILKPFGHKLETRGSIHGNFYAPEDFYAELGLPDPPGLAQARSDLAIKHLPQADLYPDALEVLNHLHQSGKTLALVSSSPRQAIVDALKRFAITDLFQAVVSADDINHFKPHPEPFEKALAALKGTKDRAIAIGDSSVDIEAANRFGIDSIAFMPPEHDKYYDFDEITNQNPTYSVSDFRKIMEIIK